MLDLGAAPGGWTQVSFFAIGAVAAAAAAAAILVFYTGKLHDFKIYELKRMRVWSLLEICTS